MDDGFVQQKFDRLEKLAKEPVHLYNKSANGVCRNLGRLLDQAKDELDRNEYEGAYIWLLRWKLSAQWVRTNSKSLDENLKAQFVSSQKVSNFSKLFTDTKNILQRKYEGERKARELENNNHKFSLDIDDIDKFLPDTPTDEPKEKSDDEISCRELREICQDNGVLVIDIRDEDDFNKSTISIPNLNIINIQPKSIALDQLSTNYISELCAKFTSISFDRPYPAVKKIVLFDRESFYNDIGKNNLLRNLQRKLQEWQSKIDYEKKGFADCKIYILNGGWKEWNLIFPDDITKTVDKKNQELTKSISPSDVQNLDIKKLNLENSDIKNSQPMDVANGDESKIEIPNPASKIETLASASKIETSLLDNSKRKRIFAQTDIIDQKLMGVPKVVLKKLQPIIDRTKKPKDKSNCALKPVSFNTSEADWKKEDMDASRMEKSLYPSLDSTDLFKFQAPKNYLTKHDKENDKPAIPQDQHFFTSTDMDVDSHKEESNFVNEQSKSPVGGGGLKRSISSPNLAQINKVEAKPEFDRTTKPRRMQERINSININREQRLEGVYVSDGKENPGITGLKNLGNSCYMNSIIQCLSNTSNLAKYFLDNTLELNNHQNSNRQTRHQYVAEEVAHVIKALWRGKYKSISPRDLKEVVGQYKKSFDNFNQQDSHEFLTFLLDWVHDDLRKDNHISDKYAEEHLSEAELQWQKSMGKKSSIISQLFFGQLRSTIECSMCANRSVTYETFNSLTLTLPQANKCNLNDCISKYTSSQTITGWKCEKCNAPREAKKKFDFVKLAPIVVIHLNRFGDAHGWLEKKNTAVEFPLRSLDLQPYLDRNYVSNSQNYVYNLYAMSNHYGTMDAGHYTAYCKTNIQNRWYKFDDQTVSEVPESTVKSQSSNAYLLFYTSISSNLNYYH